MKLNGWVAQGGGTARVVVSSAVLALGLVLVVWAGYRGTGRELMTLLRSQAASLRQTVAAAARSNLEASLRAQAELEARMLATVRMLGELDHRSVLDAKLLDEIVRQNSLFRVSVFNAEREPEYASASGLGPRRGFGPGFATGFGGNLLDQLFAQEEKDAVTDIHVSRWGDWRGFAAVRRHKGGAIVLNVDASAFENLMRQVSLDSLLADIAESTEEVVYVIFEQDGIRIAHGDIPTSDESLEGVEGEPPPLEAFTERELTVRGRSVLEFSGPIILDEDTKALLRLGMHLEDVRRAERRMLWQLGLSMAASLALATLGLGTVWLQRKYNLLSERHARVQEALRRRDRLAAMGELSSTVAHEIRNPLNAIAMSAKRLKREFLEIVSTSEEDRTEAEELLGVLEGETQRINNKVQQFLDYARPPRLTVRKIDLGELVQAVAEGARAMGAARDVRLETDVGSAVEAVVDQDQLRQALDNMVRNAIEATPEGGQVVLRVRSRGRGHEIEVVDTGHGIATEDLPRLFDLYFTTKADGTGVGLAVTQQIVTAHGGTIEVDSRPGQGTRMTVRIPEAVEEGNHD